MSRKYRQSGYMDLKRDDKPKPASRPEKSEFKGSGRVETKFQMVTRCNNCAAEIPVAGEIQAIDRCKNCGNDLHSCRNCLNFDPAARNECIKPVEVRVTSKNKNNFCLFFKAKVLIEKQGSGAAPAASGRPVDPHRQAFLDLFKN
ncbi:MAG: hypothetical protein FWF13_03880 [Acidobacteria bacterium]|nr:hypothetical protein [Acidobacteriota bacterium]